MPSSNMNCSGELCEMNGTSPEMAAKILRQLNDAKAQLYIPVILYMVVLMVAGVIGNSLVVYVYLQRLKRTSSNYFILSMAMFDMVACCVGMPTEIYDLRYPYLFHSDIACKVFRFAESVPVIGSALILVAVACDRYFKICRPFKNIPLKYVKRVCLGIAACAFLLTISTFFVFGVKDVVTPYPGVVGKDCSVMKENGRTSTISRVWFAFLTTLFVVCTVTMISLYIRIWVEIKRRQRQVLGTNFSKSSSDDSGLPKSPTSPTFRGPPPEVAPEKRSRVKYLPSQSISSDQDGGVEVTYKSRAGTLGRLGSDTSDGMDADKKSIRQIGENVITKIKASKTTVILFCVTMAFILSYLPTLVVTVVKNKTSAQLSNKEDFITKLFSKSYFINNSINPIIYSFLNVHFRSECGKTLGKLCKICLCGFQNTRSTSIQKPRR